MNEWNEKIDEGYIIKCLLHLTRWSV